MRQHEMKSVFYATGAFHAGAPILDGKDDIPFGVACDKDDPFRHDKYFVGWPVNFAIYNGKVYLHQKYFGVALSSKDHGHVDTLNPFRIKEPSWSTIDSESMILSTYVMIRNLLHEGTPAAYIKSVVDYAVNGVESPFASCQETGVLPLSQAKLIGTDEVVARVIHHGAFPIMDNDAIYLARKLRGIVTFDEWLDIDCDYGSIDVDYDPECATECEESDYDIDDYNDP